MIRIIVVLLISAISTLSYARSPSRKLFCKEFRYNNIVIVDLTKGTFQVKGDDFITKDLTVTSKTVGVREIFSIWETDSYSGLPQIAFKANVDASGAGTAISYGDNGHGGNTKYKCGLRYILPELFTKK